MGHQDQDGEGQMSLFDWNLEAAMDREKQKQAGLSWAKLKLKMEL